MADGGTWADGTSGHRLLPDYVWEIEEVIGLLDGRSAVVA
jgi:hypothetical protein